MLATTDPTLLVCLRELHLRQMSGLFFFSSRRRHTRCLSDWSSDVCSSDLAAVALGASILEKHFTSDTTWPGPDVPISIDPNELKDLVEGSRAIHQALGGSKTILPEEKPTIDFAYACVVTLREIGADELLSA